MKTLMILVALALSAQADDFFEAREAANNPYRYADWSHTFSNKVATDTYYIGVPGNNEFDLCGGYQLPSKDGFTIVPFFCGVVAKEDREAGVKVAALLTYERGKWKSDAYIAHFFPLGGTSGPYDLADAANLTRAVGKSWEIGVSTGFFHQNGSWNPLAGPLVRKNDKAGFWALSLRGGSANELRFIRTFTVTKHPGGN